MGRVKPAREIFSLLPAYRISKYSSERKKEKEREREREKGREREREGEREKEREKERERERARIYNKSSIILKLK